MGGRKGKMKERGNALEKELNNPVELSDEEMDKRFQEALRIAIEIKKAKGVPIAKYDLERREPYLEYPDGSREYVSEET